MLHEDIIFVPLCISVLCKERESTIDELEWLLSPDCPVWAKSQLPKEKEVDNQSVDTSASTSAPQMSVPQTNDPNTRRRPELID